MLLLLLACAAEPTPEPSPASAPVSVVAPLPAQRPDIVLLVVDTLRVHHLGLHGHVRPTTPHLDALAAQGAWFSRAYAQSPWTLASFASLLTGLYPHQHRVGRDDANPVAFGHLGPKTATLAGTLQAAGYATHAIVNNTFLAPEFGLQRGFDTYDFQGSTNTRHRLAADTVDAGLAWLDTQTMPAFLMLHFMEPHLDYDPPAEVRGTFAKGDPPAQLVARADGQDPFTLLQMGIFTPTPETRDYVVALYDEEVLGVDRAIGRLAAGLDERARWDRTALVVTADHGEAFWEHGRFEHGSSLYSEQTQVPLVARGAGVAPGRVDTVVEHVDLFQGVLALAGVAPPAGTRGEDLFALARGAPADRMAMSENLLYGPPMLSVVDGNTRFVLNQATGAGEAWAVGPDGNETERLQGRAQLEAGRRLLAALQERRGDLEPIRLNDTVNVSSYEIFEQLGALGYLDER